MDYQKDYRHRELERKYLGATYIQLVTLDMLCGVKRTARSAIERQIEICTSMLLVCWPFAHEHDFSFGQFNDLRDTDPTEVHRAVRAKAEQLRR